MFFIADFHIHSHYSRATSKLLVPQYLDYWADLKGIKVIGTGDFTHPKWLEELKEKLEPAEAGLFQLKKEYRLNTNRNGQTRFILTTEISNIYKKKDKVRKIHNVIFVPDFETAENIQKKLKSLEFNITSDGRPILGMDAKNLLDLVLNVNQQNLFVPAHIWTPWFSLLGDKSGFNSVEECFEDLSSYIYAVETGLSSNPPMNWLCSSLDPYTLLSNSDAHSPENIGRNANIFNTNLDYQSIIQAIKTGDQNQFLGTIDLFPQEGKYHFDGHRKCNVCFNPLQSLKNNNICPVCQKKLTIGVLNRVMQISDRSDPEQRKNKAPFHSIIPLKEILSEIFSVGEKSKKVDQAYHSIIQKAGPELDLLLHHSYSQIEKLDFPLLTEAIRRMRKRQIIIQEGFDGEYGKIKVFDPSSSLILQSDQSLFSDFTQENKHQLIIKNMLDFDLKEYRILADQKQSRQANEPSSQTDQVQSNTSNQEQTAAINHAGGPALIIAGPGTGKTRTLSHRILNLIKKHHILPDHILAVTFTNKAANEMKERIQKLLKKEKKQPLVSTFHGLGYQILKQNPACIQLSDHFTIISDDDKKLILQKSGLKKKDLSPIITGISRVKQNLKTSADLKDQYAKEIFDHYQKKLRELSAFDLDDLLYESVLLLKNKPDLLLQYHNQFNWIMVDEYQDINFVQYQLIRLLSSQANSNLCVIGDPDQAIYGFRGADVRFINQFLDDYPTASIYALKKSYRCSEYILKASQNIIQGNKNAAQQLTGLNKGVKLKIVSQKTAQSEAEFIARTIDEMIGGLSFFSIDSQVSQGNQSYAINSLSNFAILCRIKAQMPHLEKALLDHHIPYQKVDNTPFFRQGMINELIDLLMLAGNPDNPFLKMKIKSSQTINLNEEKLKLIFNQTKMVSETIKIIAETFFHEKEADYLNEIEQLIDLARSYKNNLPGFLQYIVLGESADDYEKNTETVTLMTLHAAKGLEFECVFIPGCEEGLIPYSLYEQHKSNLEEENRLFYVGMTRAKKLLFLSHAEKRKIAGQSLSLKKSLFLERIEKELYETPVQTAKKKKEETPDLF